MTGVMTIARHELSRRWMLWLIAGAVGQFGTMLPWFSQDSRLAEVCTLGAVALSWGIAFVIGMSLLGRPLHDGRLAFFFTRPVHGHSIAAGKLIGGLVLVVGIELLLLAPLASSDVETIGHGGLLFVVAIAVVFLAAGVVAGILARSRSRWFLADAIGGTAAALLAVAVFGEVNGAQREAVRLKWTPEEAGPLFDRIDLLMRGLAVTAIVIIFVAATFAIAVGRTDRERVHRSLSLVLWSSLGVTGLAGVVLAHWGLL